jgi:hypothetical protein
MGSWPAFATRVSALGVLLWLAACSADSGPSAGMTANRTSGSTGTAGALGANPPGSGLIGTAGGSSVVPVGAVPPGASNTCARGTGTASPVTPTVWLIVDGSSSMDEVFAGNQSRWQALRSTLMDPGGVVDTLQANVRFGMVIYGGAPMDQMCVKLVTVAPALNNLSNLASQYPTSPLGMSTPTDRALEYVVNNLPVLNQAVLDTKRDPVYVVLATDGQPNDMCAAGGRRNGGGGGGQSSAVVEQRVIDLTTQGTAAGMQMFVVSLAGNDAMLQNHLMLVSQATASKTPPFVPSTQTGLVAAFREIVNGASCQVALEGMVAQGRECTGTVELNGLIVPCNQSDGWRLFNSRTVQLTGKACDTFLSHDSLVVANFSCDVFSPD